MILGAGKAALFLKLEAKCFGEWAEWKKGGG